MTAEEIIQKLKDKDCYAIFGSMLNGCGLDRSPREFGKGRALYEKLVKMGIIDLGKNYTKDTTGMYYIKNWRDYKGIDDCIKKRLETTNRP